MGFGKFIKKVVKKVSKSVKKAVKNINPIFALESSVSLIVEKSLGEIAAPTLDKLGLDSLSKEVTRWSEDLGQINKVLSGQYADAQKDLSYAQTKYENALKKYEKDYAKASTEYNTGLQKLIDELDQLFAFHEIFKMAAANDIESYGDFVAPSDTEVVKLYKEYKKLADKLKSEYDFIISLKQGGILEKALHSMITIMGGITSDLKDIANGEADSTTWKKIISVVIAIVLVVIAILAAIPSGGSSLQLIPLAIAILTTISTLLMLDAMYGAGSLMESIFDMFDFLFNDLMNLDDIIGSDFEKFDSENEDYKEMTMYFQMAITISAALLSLGSSMSGSSGGSTMWTETKASVTEYTSSTFGLSAESGILGTSMTYADLYSTYSTAMSVKDMLTANDSYDKLKTKLNEDLTKVNTIIEERTNKNFMKHYKDTAYFLQDQQEYIDRYVWSMVSQNMYVDPYGTTPVANIRFEPDKSLRTLSFGFEDIFNEDAQAGSKNYFNNILYSTD